MNDVATGAAAEAAQAVASRLAQVRERIGAAAWHAGRSPDDVTLVAVSKTFSPDHIRLAVEAGATDLGENRVQEAEAKVPLLPTTIRWHLIGHLQSNKVNVALQLFSLIHGVDSAALAERLSRHAQQRGARPAVLLQVNVAQKESQFGFGEEELPAAFRQIASLPALVLDGLMCIAPEVADAEETRPYFRRLAALHRQLAPVAVDAGHPWRHLSMGMSNDFPVAIDEGATLVRVGRAIFGERERAPEAGARP